MTQEKTRQVDAGARRPRGVRVKPALWADLVATNGSGSVAHGAVKLIESSFCIKCETIIVRNSKEASARAVRAYACQQEPRADVPAARLLERPGLQLVAQSPRKTPRRGVWAVSRVFQGIPQWNFLVPAWSVEPEDDPANSRVRPIVCTAERGASPVRSGRPSIMLRSTCVRAAVEVARTPIEGRIHKRTWTMDSGPGMSHTSPDHD